MPEELAPSGIDELEPLQTCTIFPTENTDQASTTEDDPSSSSETVPEEAPQTGESAAEADTSTEKIGTDKSDRPGKDASLETPAVERQKLDCDDTETTDEIEEEDQSPKIKIEESDESIEHVVNIEEDAIHTQTDIESSEVRDLEVQDRDEAPAVARVRLAELDGNHTAALDKALEAAKGAATKFGESTAELANDTQLAVEERKRATVAAIADGEHLLNELLEGVILLRAQLTRIRVAL